MKCSMTTYSCHLRTEKSYAAQPDNKCVAANSILYIGIKPDTPTLNSILQCALS